MILTGPEIEKMVAERRIRIDTFRKEHVNTNSYDVRLGGKYLVYSDQIIDPRVPAEHQIFDIPADGLCMQPGQFLLAETEERVGSDHFVPILHAKSGTARSGLFVHITADLIDIGSFGKITLQLYATLPVRIFPGQRIAQVSFWKPHGEIRLYAGKYQGSDGPRPSLTYKDFEPAALAVASTENA
ncbi:MAG: dCTP deaminase [Pseudomonadota bacterium]|nr:dCTP deaminase [Pseudomonadota bacterium]